MGTLANSFFQIFLSWIRILCAEIWNTVSSEDGSALATWIGKNWLAAAVFLCVTGVAVDLIVYLFRWQPYRIWRSKRQKKKNRLPAIETHKSETEETEEDPIPLQIQTQPERTDNQSRTEWISSDVYQESSKKICNTKQNQPPDGMLNETSPEIYYRPERIHAKRYVESVYDEPDEELFHPDAIEKAETVTLNRESNTEKFEKAIRPRRRRRVRDMLADGREDTTPAPEQLIDRNEAYRQPIYPRSWHERESDSI